MNGTTSIDEQNVTISTSDVSMGGLSFHNNKKIVFLPINVGEKFPNLINYNAAYCSVKEVLKLNFKNLNKLKTLALHYNQIEKIGTETFSDLTSLEELNLSKENYFLLIFLIFFLTIFTYSFS